MKEIYEMKGAGRSIRGIAQELDVSRNTVRRYPKPPEAMRPRLRPPRGSKLDLYDKHARVRPGLLIAISRPELQGSKRPPLSMTRRKHVIADWRPFTNRVG